MSNLAVIAGRPVGTVAPGDIAEAINPLGLLDVESSRSDDLLLFVGQHAQAPCRKVAYSAHEDYTCLVAGDVVNPRRWTGPISDAGWPTATQILAVFRNCAARSQLS